jgi:hypothetical protein
MSRPLITLLTDFGLEDDFVGVCHGVIAGIAPDARVLDITHGIDPQHVLQGAIALERALRYMPAGVHLAVVDPGVGSGRRGVAVRTRDGRFFVGPDNGVLMLAADAAGVDAARELTNPAYRLHDVSRTFHARDVFSPAAAHLAAGVAFEELGADVDPATLVRLEIPSPDIGRTQIDATVLTVDRFGNFALNLRGEHLEAIGLAAGQRAELRLALDRYYALVAETFADAPVGELIVYEDSYGAIAVAISGGNAAALTNARPGDSLRIAPGGE